MVRARQGQGLQPLSGLQGLVALGIERIMKKLHVQLVILDDEDFLGHHHLTWVAGELATPR
jgi:hypothetical protein